MASVRPSLRSGTHDTPLETGIGLNDAKSTSSGAGRPLDVADPDGLHATPSGTWHRRRPALALGATATLGEADPDASVEEFCNTSAPGGHAGRSTETPRSLTRTAQRAAPGSGEALPGAQEERLKEEDGAQTEFRDGLEPHRETRPG